MSYPVGSSDQRGQPRVSLELPVTISVGSQITLKGQLKDLSLTSAFVKIKYNVYLKVNDEIGITIQNAPTESNLLVEGTACISRIVPGEGFVVYFTKIDDSSLKCIKKLMQKLAI